MVMATANVLLLITRWKNVNFQQFQKELDVAANDITGRQDESEASRKRLVELSREFKKDTTEDVRKAVAPLLKSFQAEIDNLSKRAREAEVAFLHVYKTISHIPDPSGVFEWCTTSAQPRLMRAQDLEIENKQLRETLNDYNQELKEVRNQEITIKNLKEQLRQYEESLEAQVMARAKDKERELIGEFNDRERCLQENTQSANRKLGDAEAKINNLQSALENTQSDLFDLRTKYDNGTHAKSDEMEILLNDLERASQRATIAEKEMERFREKLSAVTNHKKEMPEERRRMQRSSVSSEHDDSEENHCDDNGHSDGDAARRRSRSRSPRDQSTSPIRRKNIEVSELAEDVQRLQATINKIKETSASQIAQLEVMLEQKNKVIQTLEEKLTMQKDYEEIKRELSILKSIEFSGLVQPMGSSAIAPEDGTKPLEFLLMQKTKALQAETTALKMSQSDLTTRFDELFKQHSDAIATMCEQKELIEKLERDLSSVNVIQSGTNSILLDIPDERGEAEGQDHETNGVFELRKPSLTEKTADSSLLPIIVSQRERYRSRVLELEVENDGLRQKELGLHSEVGKLREDNVSLYGKIRFLQSYSATNSKMTSGSNPNDDSVSVYSRQYEERLDPFTTFTRKEQQRTFSTLSPIEKVTLTLGRTILSNKYFRTFALIYSVLIHCLIFLVLFKLANTEVCKRQAAVEYAHKYIQHMHDVHGEEVQYPVSPVFDKAD